MTAELTTQDPAAQLTPLLRLAPAGDDWENVDAWAHEEALVSLIVAEGDAAGVPPRIWQAWLEESRWIAAANLQRARRVMDVLARLHSAGVTAVVLKGPGVGIEAYGSPAVRPFSDVDLLVAPRDCAAAFDVLQTMGARPRYTLDRGREALVQQRYPEWAFDLPDLAIDLHWRLGSFTFTQQAEELLARRRHVERRELRLPVPGLEDHLIFLCLHLAKHGWSGLLWLSDIAHLLAKRAPEIDWAYVDDSCQHPGRRAPVCVALLLAHRIFGAPLPRQVRDSACADVRIGRLLHQAHRRMTGPWNAPERGRWWLQFRTLNSIRDRLYCLTQPWKPTVLEWQMVSLPRSLYGLYYPLRILRLLGKYGWRRCRMRGAAAGEATAPREA